MTVVWLVIFVECHTCHYVGIDHKKTMTVAVRDEKGNAVSNGIPKISFIKIFGDALTRVIFLFERRMGMEVIVLRCHGESRGKKTDRCYTRGYDRTAWIPEIAELKILVRHKQGLKPRVKNYRMIRLEYKKSIEKMSKLIE